MVYKEVFTTDLKHKITARCYRDNWRMATLEGQHITAKEYGFEMLKYIMDIIKMRLEKDLDSVVLLTGEEQFGKSTLAAHLAIALGIKSPGEISFNSRAFYEQLKNAPDRSTLWYDEGARGLYNRDAMDRFQRRMAKSFTMIGMKHFVTIICLPHRQLLDIHLRERRIMLWGHVVMAGYQRGYVKWRYPEKNEWQLPAFWKPLFVMRFPKFTDNDGFKWDEYERLKREALANWLEEEDDLRPRMAVPLLTKSIQYLSSHDKLTPDEIASIVGTSRSNVYKYINRKKYSPHEYQTAERQMPTPAAEEAHEI